MKSHELHSEHRHSNPITRRDFLARGLLGYSALGYFPLFGNAFAGPEGCGSTGESFVPFLVFDMAGGAGLPGNFLVGGKGGPENLLEKYTSLGWNPRESGAIDSRFGIPMAAKAGKIFEGITTTASVEAQANLRMGSFCHFSRDDTNVNPASALSFLIKLGYQGRVQKKALGKRNTASGGNSNGVLVDPVYKPLYVDSVTSFINSAGFGQAFEKYPASLKRDLLNITIAASAEHSKKYVGTPHEEKFKKIMKCSYEETLKFIESVPGLDPRQDPMFQKIYSITPQTLDENISAVSATLVMNVLRGVSGPGVITLGGCDYHDGTQTTGDAKDLEMGREIGRAVEAAHQLKTPLFFQLLTDGGVYAREETRNWLGDAGDKSMTVIGYFDPRACPTQRKLQVGHYTNGQSAALDTFIGNNVARTTYCVVANYLHVMDKFDLFPSLGFQGLSPSELEESRIFG